MDVSAPLHPLFWVLVAVSSAACLGIAFWTLRAGRNVRLIPTYVVFLGVVLGATYWVCQSVSRMEIGELIEECEKADLVLVSSLSRVEGQEARNELVREYVELGGDSRRVELIHREEGFSVLGKVPVGTFDAVWEGEAVETVLTGENGIRRYLVMASPIQDGGEETDTAVVTQIPMMPWEWRALDSQEPILMMGLVMVALVLLTSWFGGEMFQQLALLHASRLELLLKGERITEQMEIIAEKNEAMEESRSRLQAANEQLHTLATTDGLTGVLNRRELMNFLYKSVERCALASNPCSVVMLDIDDFKKLNDEYGHAAGDDALKTVAQVIQRECRGGMGVGRYGGEEFMVVLPGCSESAAIAQAEKIRKAVEETPQTSRTCTLSIGVGTSYGMGKSGERLIDEADQALYHSKRGGKNRVTHFGHGVHEGGVQENAG